MAPGIDILRIQEHHLVDILSLVTELAVYERAPDAVTASLEDYEKNWRKGFFDGFVAQQGESILGLCLFYDAWSTWKGRMLYLEDFIVREAWRRSGVGQALWHHLVNFARSEGYALIKWQVLEWNDPAIAFYQKQGAEIERDWWNGKLLF